ncbi:MAG TPA: 1-(5-phosphoribosyl)-5-[(5-phosphoribosylamino)methylideneamino]imidazole-4-carboxamide isomerase [Candidatus Hydrogenedentes bacterium]|nr:1-(5-phosphoribosyl)-5-[(5-phosphoribosylamino)methylideneamino]imidazole-4-carboxamide isomerase [Candidatus Hydrogenedentota bacterium]
MRIVPAVDIRGGRCVNLLQGDYAQETVFSEDPVAQAIIWHDALGEGLVHIVDLDGAKQGRCCIEKELRAMATAGVPFEVGGGIRNFETIRNLFEAGASRVILGTAAYRDPDLLREACRTWPEGIAVGIDAREGKPSLSGWLEDTDGDALDFARRVEAAGATRIIYTDILRDGMMGGPNLDMTRTVARAANIPVTISGGVSSLDDIRAARALEADGVDEIIIGRALYLGAFTVQEAVAAARE